MKRLFILFALICFLIVSAPAFSSEISNFFYPYGFKTPLLKGGQWASSIAYHYRKDESWRDPLNDPFYSKNIRKTQFFSLRSVYALVDRIILETSLDFFPEQTRVTYWNGNHPKPLELISKNRSNFFISPSFDVSFRPKRNIDIFGTFYCSKEKQRRFICVEPFFETEMLIKTYHLNFGFIMLGNSLFAVFSPLSDPEVNNFIVPYGFRMPVLNQWQRSISFSFQYWKTEADLSYLEFHDIMTEKRYNFSLDVIYALTKDLVLKSNLDIYPAQDRKTNPGYYAYYTYGDVKPTQDMIRSEFNISPFFSVSFRPKDNIELNGSFFIRRENFKFDKKFQSAYLDDRRKLWYFDLGLSFLGRLSQITAPVMKSEFSNFFIPYGFSTPPLKPGQFTLNINYRYHRTEYEGDEDAYHGYRSYITDKEYYISLNAALGAANCLVLKGCLDFYPSQNRTCYRTDKNDSPWYMENEHSNSTVCPSLLVSLRPRTNLNLYVGYYWTEEKLHSKGEYAIDPQWDERRYEKRKAWYLDFGLTILGNLW
ncbi:MAG: hypothetical protein AMJ90_09870 [candidate division Zixibacteria bacterium SM23_73_2]|nr:MAG: hypothetical protein AMJ90_09870 [candidate division Zixibacteria bacterium SM23_73_2]